MKKAISIACLGVAMMCLAHHGYAYAQAFASPYPTPNPPSYRHVYRIADIGKLGIPKLNARQAAWVKTIKTNSYWKKRIHHLWFSFDDDTPSNRVIVFYVENWMLYNGMPGKTETYQVLGEGCGNVFTRYKEVMEVFPLPDSGATGGRCYVDPLAGQTNTNPAALAAPADEPHSK